MKAVTYDTSTTDGHSLFWCWDGCDDRFLLLDARSVPHSAPFGFICRFDGAPFSTLLQTVVAGDRRRVLRQFARCRRRRITATLVYRMMTPAGETAVVTRLSHPLKKAEGGWRIVGVTQLCPDSPGLQCPPRQRDDAHQSRQRLVETFVSTLSAQIGECFFRGMVSQLARMLEATEVYVAELKRADDQWVGRSIARVGGNLLGSTDCFRPRDDVELRLLDGAATIETLLEGQASIQRILSQDEQWLGACLNDPEGNLLGLIVIRAPFAGLPLALASSLLRACAGRASVELARLQADTEARLAALAFESHDGIIIADPQRRILRVNHAFTRITGYAAAEVCGLSLDTLCARDEGSLCYRAMLDQCDSHGHWRAEQQRCRKNGERYPQRETVTRVTNRSGRLSHYVLHLEDLSERNLAEKQQPENLAYYDELTGLPNRRMLLDRLAPAVAAARHNERIGALLFIDLDHFKPINDSLGHATGDWLLQQVAERLRTLVRQQDLLARLGGDEFVILLPELGDSPPHAELAASRIGERLIREVSAPYPFDGQTLHVGASVGITLFPGRGQDYQDLLKQADTAMYHAKTAGRQRLCFFDDRMQRKADRRLLIHNALCGAIAKRELRLYYQPQHFVTSGELVGMEALLRWQRYDGGALISPAEFIRVAEESDLIIDIGRWVLHQACSQFVSWRSAGQVFPQISVNVSAKQFHHGGFVDDVTAILRETGMDPTFLNLEITESVALGHAENTIGKMAQLKRLGISFAIDDFGAGYSSLAYLKRLPADELKIDRAFIRDLPRDHNDMAIVEAVLAMARHMGFNVTAEGVETRQQLEFLQRFGCSFYQGYLASKPLPAEAFARYARRYPVAGSG